MMKHVFWLQALLSLLVSILFCSLSQAQAVSLPPNHTADPLSPCPKFQDAQNRDEAEDNYVFYRDLLKAKQWTQAFAHWQKVYAVAPAADGQRATVYLDGIHIYQQLYSISQDSFEKDSYIDRIFELYDDIQSCYPEIENIPARKALDLYHKYPHRASKEEIFQLCKEALDAEPEKVPAYLMLPITKLLKELYQNEQLTGGEVRGCIESLSKICLHNKKHCHGQPDCQYWSQIESMVIGQIEFFERVKGFYDCEYYLEKYYHLFEEDSTNYTNIKQLLVKLELADCDPGLDKIRKLRLAMQEFWRSNAPFQLDSPRQIGYQLVAKGDYQKAEAVLLAFSKKIGAQHPEAISFLLIARLCYGQFSRYQKAREYAVKAAVLNRNWGDPYILLGKIYAASDALCKEDTDKLYLPWLAVDQWLYAKKIDPTAMAEANKWIEKYKDQLPTIEMINKYGLIVGDTVHIGCWIQEETQVRVEQ